MPNSRTLIVYFSLSGNTKAVAEHLAGMLSADLEPIRTPGPPLKLSLSLISRMVRSRWFGQAWPVMSSTKRAANYDLVIIAGPIWAGRIASPVQSWMRDNPISSGARVAMIATAGGGHMSKAVTSDIEQSWHRTPLAVCAITDADRRSGGTAAKLSAFANSLEIRRAA